jgi:hypothetical protein
MTVNDEFKPNRKPLFKNASELPQPKEPTVFQREPHQCPHLQGPTFEGSSINFCDLMPGVTCIQAIYNHPEQYKDCEYKKIYSRLIRTELT